MFALYFAIYYLIQIMHSPAGFPPISKSMLYVLGGSQATYLSGKTYDLIVKLATRIREASGAGKKLTTQEKAEIRQSTFIVEMTPHYRARFHPDWTSGALTQVLGRRVKVVGQLMADNEHNLTSQNCALPGHTPDCGRSTIWELHPVTSFQVCHADNSCDVNSSDWKNLEDEIGTTEN